MVFYNEIDPFAARWIRNLSTASLIASGFVDERSIKSVRGSDVSRFRRAHFFAGIAGWEYALRLAGWPDDWPVWTGSCPCQPFSAAGKGQGESDPRHLWPDFFRLIKECRPSVIFGEQVADAIALGWIDRVFDDLESEGYACGQAVLPSCSVGSPNIRKRIYWVADTESERGRRREALAAWSGAESGRSGQNLRGQSWPDHAGGSSTLNVSDVLSPIDGIPGGVGRLRAYGNAINPVLAAEFVSAYLDVAAVRSDFEDFRFREAE